MTQKIAILAQSHNLSRCQPNFAALNRGRHLYSAGRPSRWALARIPVYHYFSDAGSLR